MREKIVDGKVTLYSRPNTAIIWAEFFDGKIQHRASTKTADLEQAKIAARKWWAQFQTGVEPVVKTPRSRTFEHASEEAIAQYQIYVRNHKRSFSYVKGLQKVFNRLNQIIGDRDVSSIDQSTWYFVKKTLMDKKPGLSTKTIKQYKNAIAVCLAECVERGEMKQEEKPVFAREKQDRSLLVSKHDSIQASERPS